jgi:hypothetical protein
MQSSSHLHEILDAKGSVKLLTLFYICGLGIFVLHEMVVFKP